MRDWRPLHPRARMPERPTPAGFAASIVASIAVVRTAAEPAREHARWLDSGHVVALDTAELEAGSEPTPPTALGDTPSDISEAIVRVLFGSSQQGPGDRCRYEKQASLSVRELQWDQVGHLFAEAVTHETLEQPSEGVSPDLGADDGAALRMGARSCPSKSDAR